MPWQHSMLAGEYVTSRISWLSILRTARLTRELSRGRGQPPKDDLELSEHILAMRPTPVDAITRQAAFEHYLRGVDVMRHTPCDGSFGHGMQGGIAA